jgi:hypothetical protein
MPAASSHRAKLATVDRRDMLGEGLSRNRAGILKVTAQPVQASGADETIRQEGRRGGQLPFHGEVAPSIELSGPRGSAARPYQGVVGSEAVGLIGLDASVPNDLGPFLALCPKLGARFVGRGADRIEAERRQSLLDVRQ